VLFYLNPLTYVVDISRAGFFSQFTGLVNIEVLLMTLFSAVALVIAIRSFMGMSDTQVSTQV
jgi:ABC-2 type transport system permease protein